MFVLVMDMLSAFVDPVDRSFVVVDISGGPKAG